MGGLPSHHQLSERLGVTPSQAVHELSIALAALIYLRWVDFREAEREAVAAFEESDFEAAAPSGALWRSWHTFPAAGLVRRLDQYLRYIDLYSTGHNELVEAGLRRAATEVCKFGRKSGDALEALVEWLVKQPFETPNDRRRLLETFDGFLAMDARPESGQYRTPDSIAQLMIEL